MAATIAGLPQAQNQGKQQGGTASDRSLRSVFVGNIPYEASEEQLKEIFSEVGPVVSFRLVFDRETGKPKGYGFCEYKDQETALSAMRNLNGYELNGRALRVDSAASEKNREEMKGMDGSSRPEANPYGAPVAPEEAPEAITQAVASLPPEQMFELMKQMKICIQNNPEEARQMLLQNPQLAYALLQAQVVMKIVDPVIAQGILHRPTEQVTPLQPAGVQQPKPLMPSGPFSGGPGPNNEGPAGPFDMGQPGSGPQMRGPPDMRGPSDMREPPDMRGPPGDARGPPDMRGPQGMRGPPDMRGPQDIRGPSDMRGPPDMRGPGPDSRDMRGMPPDMRGPQDRGPDMRGPPDRGPDMRGPPDRGPDMRGPHNRGPGDMRGPPDRGPGDMRGGPGDMRGPPDRGPGDMRGPHDRGPGDMRGPPDRGPGDMRGPHDRGPGDMRGPPDRGQGEIRSLMGDMRGPGPDQRDFRGPPDIRGPDNRGPQGPDFRGPPQDQFGDPRDRRMPFDPRDPRSREPPRDDRRGPSMDTREQPRDPRGPPPEQRFGPPPPSGPRDPRDRGPPGPPNDGRFQGPGHSPQQQWGPNQGGAPPRAPQGFNPPPGGPGGQGVDVSAQDHEKAALIMQVLSLTEQQIALLPEDQRQSIMVLKDQIAHSTQQ